MNKIKIVILLLIIGSLLISGCSTTTRSEIPTTNPISLNQTVQIVVTMQAPIPEITTAIIPETATTASPQATRTTIPPTRTTFPTKTNTPFSTTLPEKMASGISSESVVCGCSTDQYNCADFSTQAAAQSCYEYCISQGRGDIHRLDMDKDGLACENNK